MDHLRRALAPVPTAAWDQIDEEAQRTLRLTLAARRVVDVTGPTGWQTDALSSGVVELVAPPPASQVAARVRRPVPFLELSSDFELDQGDVDTADRGNPAIDTGPVVAACRRIAIAEDALVFHGNATTGTRGIVDASPHAPISAGSDPRKAPDHVASALQLLRDAGINGPYALVVGDALYTALQGSTDHGEPIRGHLTSVLYGGPVVWSSALDGAVVLSTRGGDFELALGQDLAIGYRGTEGDAIRLYVEESLAFRVLTPEAAVHLVVG
jgi:uncharacterized linocin/CFP29 family protein